MYDNSIQLIQMPEYDSISVCVHNEVDGLFALGERINARFEAAYMNGYNWDAVIQCYVRTLDPELMNDVQTSPEAGMFSAYMSYSPNNLAKMQRFEAHVRTILMDEDALMAFIEENQDKIEWD
ncbi:MAG: Imm51 family immunity protein [Candidatus Promineifilaceae bacterium]